MSYNYSCDTKTFHLENDTRRCAPVSVRVRESIAREETRTASWKFDGTKLFQSHLEGALSAVCSPNWKILISIFCDQLRARTNSAQTAFHGNTLPS